MRLLAALLLAASAAFAAPQIDLVVHGPGDDAWSKFGHCALRVGGENGVVYSYGYADFFASGFAWRYIRREAMFRLHARTWKQELEVYRGRDRTVTVYPLDLTDDQAEFIAKRLAQPLEYRYEHQTDNCATRIRDLIDEAKGGAVRARFSGGDGTYRTYRSFTRSATHETPWLAFLLELAGGPNQDYALSGWDALYLPDSLVALADAERGKVVYRRMGPPLGRDGIRSGPTRPFLYFAFALAILIALDIRSARWLAAVVFGTCGLLVWTLVLFSRVADFAWNENVFLFWPTDLVLLGIRTQYYTWLRLAGIGVAAIAFVESPQPTGDFMAAALAVVFAAAIRDLRARQLADGVALDEPVSAA